MPLWHSAFPTAWGHKKSARNPETVNSFIQTRWLSLALIVILFFSSMFKPGPSNEFCINTHTQMCMYISDTQILMHPWCYFGESPPISRAVFIPRGLTVISFFFKTNTSKTTRRHEPLKKHFATELQRSLANLYVHWGFMVCFFCETWTNSCLLWFLFGMKHFL